MEQELKSKEQLQNHERPAYPTNGRMHSEMTGLTKREVFAMAAMQGICSQPAGDQYCVNGGWLHPETVTKAAIEIADELLKQLEK